MITPQKSTVNVSCASSECSRHEPHVFICGAEWFRNVCPLLTHCESKQEEKEMCVCVCVWVVVRGGLEGVDLV